MRRSFIPVRDVIQSSEVSRNVERSSLVKTAGGSPSPQPVIAAYDIDFTSACRPTARPRDDDTSRSRRPLFCPRSHQAPLSGVTFSLQYDGDSSCLLGVVLAGGRIYRD